MFPNPSLASVRVCDQVRLPKVEDRPARRFRIRLLGAVQSYTLEHARFGAGPGPVVPVVAVKLDDETVLGERGVNGELPADYRLPVVLGADALNDFVAYALGLGGRCELLRGVHGEESLTERGVGVPARKSAVGRVVGEDARRRPTECCAADSTGVRRLVSALVRVVARYRAEPGTRLAARSVEGRFAPFAGDLASGPTTGPRGCGAVAGQGAETLVGTQPCSDRLAATGADDSPDFVLARALCHRKSVA